MMIMTTHLKNLTNSHEHSSIIDSAIIDSSIINPAHSIRRILASLAGQLLSSAQSEEEKVAATSFFCLLRYELEAEFKTYKMFFVLPKEILQLVEGESFLEIGMGDGSNLYHLVQHKNPTRVVGIDLSPSMVRLARQKIPNHNSLFFAEDILTFDRNQLPQTTFDTVILLNVLDRCAAPRQLLCLIGSFVKPGGKLILGNCQFQYTKKLENGQELVYSPVAQRVRTIEEAAQFAGFNTIVHSFKNIPWQPESAWAGKEDLLVDVIIATKP